MKKGKTYDLIVVGASSVGVAAAYEAINDGKSVCLLEINSLTDESYVKQKPITRMSQLIYNEEYMIKFVEKSYKHWHKVENKAGKRFIHSEGTLMFGSTNVSTSQGSIESSVRSLKATGVEHLHMRSINGTQPSFFKSFRFDCDNPELGDQNEWEAVFTERGGSVDM